jgi:pyruvate dehydrogenase complex dehydrogenase (E1) component
MWSVATLYQLAQQKLVKPEVVAQAIKDLEINPNKLNPLFA